MSDAFEAVVMRLGEKSLDSTQQCRIIDGMFEYRIRLLVNGDGKGVVVFASENDGNEGVQFVQTVADLPFLQVVTRDVQEDNVNRLFE